MNYTALYRRFRPTNFEEMVGQEHITRTLKNQIMAGRVGHAYLFNGGRGTGKTSSAKILARAINCLDPKEGEPCNECEICKAAINGSLTDIVEMDAASNNSVEDIRQIREEVNFLPTKAKYRIYIIDEVHMLSTGAFNALLKTLEEPPEHVKFILATTEPQKLPATILSRCQRFDFKQISNEDIIRRLKIVCKEMKIEISEEALKTISILAEGGMRDALSILERCLQDGETKIDEDKVKDLVGIPKITYINKIVNSIASKDVTEALNTIEEVTNDGKDIQNFLWEIIKYIKDILVYKSSKKLDLYSESELKNIEELSNKFSKEELLKIIYTLSNLENEIKYSSQRLILFQVGIIKLCSGEIEKQNNTSVDNNELINLQNKISSLEMKIAGLGNEVINKPANYVENMKTKTSESIKISKTDVGAGDSSLLGKKQEQKPQIQTTPVQNISTGEKLETWSKIVNELKDAGKIMLYTNLINSIARKENDLVITIEFPKGLTPFGKAVLEKSENISEIERRISIEFGKPMKIKYIDTKANNTAQVTKQNPIESFAEDNGIPFNVVE
ncbi:MAG: DNA polymerase III subunit gamma/tau [Clostridia bacterium]|nr:DNA polymerase III subunit gamma/tau [Clostridia bacterium]